METQKSITEWARATFGPAHPFHVAARMGVEVAELISGLAAQSDLRPEEMDPRALRALQAECADVNIMLKQIAEMLGVDLDEVTNSKMRINRARSWFQTATGRHQHVEGEQDGRNG